MSMYWIIFIGFALLSWLVSSRLQNKFEKYSKIPMPNGMTGKDVAEKMLHDNGIYDVKVISTPGHLTDHYNPANQTVNLSESVYYSNSIAAAAVAAHECGHAVQHATAYAPLRMRSALVPVVSFASNIMTWVLWAVCCCCIHSHSCCFLVLSCLQRPLCSVSLRFRSRSTQAGGLWCG